MWALSTLFSLAFFCLLICKDINLIRVSSFSGYGISLFLRWAGPVSGFPIQTQRTGEGRLHVQVLFAVWWDLTLECKFLHLQDTIGYHTRAVFLFLFILKYSFSHPISLYSVLMLMPFVYKFQSPASLCENQWYSCCVVWINAHKMVLGEKEPSLICPVVW